MSSDFCNLTGKRILLTGASSGIGKQTALLLAKHGAIVHLCGRDEERLHEVLKSLEGQWHQSYRGDLSDEKNIDSLVGGTPEIDGVVHSAGIIGPVPAKFIRQGDIEKLFRINYEVPVLLTAKLLQRKRIKDKSSIVFISSVATVSPYFGGALYTSAKAGLEAYSRSLALELVKRGIRSNCLQPGLVNTPLINTPAQQGQLEMVDESLQRYLKKYPMGVGEPEDVANAIIFLVANESKWISGTSIPLGSIIQ